MIGQTIESRPSPPWGVISWILLAVALDAWSVAVSNIHLAIGSLLPWLSALLLARAREKPFVARFADDALEVDEPPTTVRYADLEGLLAPNRPSNPYKTGRRSYPIQVVHREGILHIPARLNVPSDEVYGFFYGRFSPSGSRNVPTALKGYLARSERVHGAERVWTYAARGYLGRGAQPKRLQAFFLALLLSGIAWLIWGTLRGEADWIGGAAAATLLGALFTLLLWLFGRQTSRAAGRKWRQSGLVISPDGLAMVQNDLVGELRWDELRDAKLRKGSQWQTNQNMADQSATIANILLKVEGADIIIADVYDRPIALIHQNLYHCWHESRSDGRTAPILSSDKPFAPTPPPSEGIAPSDSRLG